MFKKIVFLSVVSGLFAGMTCVTYAQVYQSAMETDFSKVINIQGMLGACLFGTVLAGIGYWLLDRWLKAKGEILFNFLFSGLSFFSILGAFAVTLPLDIESPELFAGLAVPMHFFPALAWFTMKPLFIK